MQTEVFAKYPKLLAITALALLLVGAAPVLAADTDDEMGVDNKAAASSQDSAPAPAPAPAAEPDTNSNVMAAMPAPVTTEFSNANDPLASFGPTSGTVVGNRGQELRDELLRLRSSVNLNAGEFSVLRANGAAGAVQYHSTTAAITARLQNGTTRGNPILLRQWEEAEASLNEVTNSLNRLNALQTSVSADASLGSYLLESVQAAFQLSGAVDEDHDQLKLLRDEVSRLIVQLDYLRNQVADDINRQTNYLTTERGNLQSLAFAINRGELLGGNMANKQVIVNSPPVAIMPPPQAAPYMQPSSYSPTPMAAPVAPVTATQPTLPGQLGPAPMSPRDMIQEGGLNMAPPNMPTNIQAAAPQSLGRLLVLIRFNQSDVQYEQQLSQAVSTALQRMPNAEFSVIAVSPSSGESTAIARDQEVATRNAESVKRSLVQLGLPSSRITSSSTQTATAQTPEVHVYVR
jgi:hypothetical protein